MYLFEEGDEITVTLQEEIQQALEDALGVDYQEIKFYFIEIEDESDMVVLSAESDKKFAILRCPITVMEDEELQKQMDTFLKNILINHSLDTGNKELFFQLMNAPEAAPVLSEIEDVYEDGE